ncbi:class I SAM-dependent methyltransferase [Ornithinimicrobium pratense]|uniref:Class I SAM-dependent methyltransferase n=1 Tax=Ornithinimicrobium pratense TaxID=2593973 RepID=A0A5J6V3I0_9MICO|nr:class I SAM-dependent methyltransferase [Ornithinimicrobium pratense]QFG67513.1 class I SAM-dependent methyltransferase [Ornithinimicrobium pratense]
MRGDDASGATAQSWFVRADRRSVSGGFDDRETAGSRRLTGALGLALRPSPAAVLDLGCGGGELISDLRALDRDAVLVGLDPAPEAVSAASTRHAADPAVHILAGTAEELPEALAAPGYDGPRRFDLVLCHLNLGLWSDPQEGLRQAVAHLGEGGTLYLVDVAAPEDAAERDRFLALARTPQERAYLSDQLAASYDVTALDRLLRRAAAEAGAPTTVHVARGGLAGHPYDSAAAAELWSAPGVAQAVAAFDHDEAAAAKADTVLYAQLRRP